MERKYICSYCGKEWYHPAAYAGHGNGCVFEPEKYKRTKALLDRGDGRIRPIDEYRKLAVPMKASNEHTLLKTFGSWNEVAQHFGLEGGRSNVGTRLNRAVDTFVDDATDQHASWEALKEGWSLPASALKPRRLWDPVRHCWYEGLVAELR